MVFSQGSAGRRAQALQAKQAHVTRPSDARMQEMATWLADRTIESEDYTEAFEQGDDSYPIPWWKGKEWTEFTGEFPDEYQHMTRAEDLNIVTGVISSQTGYGCFDGRGGCNIHFQTRDEQKAGATERLAILVYRGILDVEDEKQPNFTSYDGPTNGDWARLRKNYPLGIQDVDASEVEASARVKLRTEGENKMKEAEANKWHISNSNTFAVRKH